MYEMIHGEFDECFLSDMCEKEKITLYSSNLTKNKDCMMVPDSERLL